MQQPASRAESTHSGCKEPIKPVTLKELRSKNNSRSTGKKEGWSEEQIFEDKNIIYRL